MRGVLCSPFLEDIVSSLFNPVTMVERSTSAAAILFVCLLTRLHQVTGYSFGRRFYPKRLTSSANNRAPSALLCVVILLNTPPYQVGL